MAASRARNCRMAGFHLSSGSTQLQACRTRSCRIAFCIVLSRVGLWSILNGSAPSSGLRNGILCYAYLALVRGIPDCNRAGAKAADWHMHGASFAWPLGAHSMASMQSSKLQNGRLYALILHWSLGAYSSASVPSATLQNGRLYCAYFALVFGGILNGKRAELETAEWQVVLCLFYTCRRGILNCKRAELKAAE